MWRIRGITEHYEYIWYAHWKGDLLILLDSLLKTHPNIKLSGIEWDKLSK